MQYRTQLLALVREAVRGININGKCGRDQLQPKIATHLAAEGFVVDNEDTRQFLRSGMPVWRSKDTGLIETTPGRRRVDIVVYSGDRTIALIETESDLDDLRPTGVTKRNGHYDVFSIARGHSGVFYDSYKSLERMAAAAFYWSSFGQNGSYPSPTDGPKLLGHICSDRPEDHNPGQLVMILVSGSCRGRDSTILQTRLASLCADLVCVTTT